MEGVKKEYSCPKCGYECYRESVHNGVGIIYGPYGCSACGWSEDQEYDLSEGQNSIRDNFVYDQWGGVRRIE